LAGRGNFRLAADGCPHACQGWQAVNFDFILENQDFGSVFLDGVFFKRCSRFLALV
jgi:hypothetical protein